MTAVIETARLRLRHLWVDRHDAVAMRELLNEAAFHQHIGDRGVRTAGQAGH
ncbi:MAG: hypothetical protein ACOH1V_07075 [Stenotrophomonas sp.]